jgi:hypothetical protein
MAKQKFPTPAGSASTVFVAIALALLGSLCSAAQGLAPLSPIDEAVRRPDFFAFRAHLQAALAQHDVNALLEVVHPNIKSSFGGDDGIDAFKTFWRIQDPDSKLWRELATVLALGGSFDGADSFTAPYTFARWPQEADSFENVAVIGSNVQIRTEPRIGAPTIASVSFSVLHLASEALRSDWRSNEWTAITINGRKGYIATRFIRTPIDYRAIFTYSGGRWQMTVFVAGD